MQNLTIQRANDLAPNVKSALEALLGRALENGEEISVMAFRPHSAPSSAERGECVERLVNQMNDMADRVRDASDEELNEVLDEAMRSVRPGYRSVK